MLRLSENIETWVLMSSEHPSLQSCLGLRSAQSPPLSSLQLFIVSPYPLCLVMASFTIDFCLFSFYLSFSFSPFYSCWLLPLPAHHFSEHSPHSLISTSFLPSIHPSILSFYFIFFLYHEQAWGIAWIPTQGEMRKIYGTWTSIPSLIPGSNHPTIKFSAT